MAELPDLVITGSTGAVGGRVAARLAARGVPQRLLVRDAARAPTFPGCDLVEASDYGAGDEMRRALKGARTLFLVSGREHQERLRQHFTAVDAAVTAGVERIVYLSFLGAAADSTFTLGRQHFATEQHIRATGLRFSFLRNSLYADFVPYFAGPHGIIRGPAGTGRVSWVTRDDIADVAVEVLLSDGYDGAALDVTGPEALSMAETAAVLQRVAGRPVSYLEETIDEAWASRRPTGAPDWEIEGWVSSYAAVAAGELDPVSDSVERVTGRPARALEPFLRSNPELWARLAAEPSS
jgi:uncharacterized protein YbjT (DUF2867 family)